jgi:hypothetical protein
MDHDTYAALLQQLTALEAKFAHVSGRSGSTVQTPPAQTLQGQLEAQRAQIRRLDALIAELGLPPVDPQP